MKRSATFRLTLGYLAIIMLVSLFFSFIIFRVAVGETDRGLQRQVTSLRPNLYFLRPNDLNTARNDELESYKHRIIARLILLNGGMLVFGAGLSYFLARRHLEPLEEALAAQERFTSDAAHELRTPLTAMKTETEVGLRDRGLKLADAKSLLKSNLEEIAKLETLTNALLRLARSTNGNAEEGWQTVPLKEITVAAINRVQPAAESHKIRFRETLGSQKVRGDRDQLVELVTILLDNAVKYGTDGMEVTLKSWIDGDRVKLSIADQGIGMKQSDLPHIFERFYRADQSRNKKVVGGYGLGLSLAQQIVKQHGGTIGVNSSPEKGTTFTMAFPVPDETSKKS